MRILPFRVSCVLVGQIQLRSSLSRCGCVALVLLVRYLRQHLRRLIDLRLSFKFTHLMRIFYKPASISASFLIVLT